MSENFKVDPERDFIMQKIFEGLQTVDTETRENAMQCLVELGRQEYEYIKFYFATIADVTAKAARTDDYKVGAQGIEFWTSLAEEEIYRQRKGQPI